MLLSDFKAKTNTPARSDAVEKSIEFKISNIPIASKYLSIFSEIS